MAVPAVLKIDVIVDAAKAVSGLDETSKAAGSMKDNFKTAGKAVAGAVGTAAIISFGKDSIAAANESAVATARLDQVFKSMGDTTGEASKQAQAYASAMSAKTAIDDEAIMAAQAQLATFGAVSDQTARSAGVFDRATSAAADLAAAGFGSLDSNAVQLGKALQDPTKGMTALAKSGVTFTDAQKDQIKALQDSGQLLEAQKIVLGAVETQVKGTAEATATSSDKATLKFGEMQEMIGAKLLPVVNVLADLFTKYGDVLIPLVGIIAAVVAINAIWNAVMLMNPIILIVAGIVAFIAILVLAYQKVDWFRAIIDTLWQVFKSSFDAILDIVKVVYNWIKDNWPLLLAIMTGPIGVAVLIITKNWDTIKDAARAVVDWVMDRWNDLTGFLSRIVQTYVTIFSAIVEAIKLPIAAATEVYNWVTGKIQALADFISNIIGSISSSASSIANALKGPINAVIRAWNRIEFSIPGVDVGPVHFGGITIGTPDIPELAKGGVVLRTGLALVHEGEQFSGVGRKLGGSTVNITVQTTGLGADAPSIQRAVAQALRGYTARNGPLPFPVSSRIA